MGETGCGLDGWDVGRGGEGECQGDRGMMMECLYIHEY